MAISADSYGAVLDVMAFTRHLLDGETAFNSTSRPTLTEVEGMIDRASAALNLALASCGLTVPVTATTPALACDEWVIGKVVRAVEETRNVGYDADEGKRKPGQTTIASAARQFAKDNRVGFVYLGVVELHSAGEGLKFTAQTVQADRDDPDNTALEQPQFTRGMIGE